VLQPAVAERIKVVGLDVDGVMTDAGVYIGAGPHGPIELKRFNIQDSIGIKLLQSAGIEIVVVSGRTSEATELRARELGIDEIFQDRAARKLPAFQQMLDRAGVTWDEAAFVGDDLPDIPLLKRVGLPVTVQNAVPEVREVAAYVTSRSGGFGAVREFAEVLLKTREEWDEVVRRYLTERDESMEREVEADHGDQ
jgi:3-deoxy-D-manno-octulosonate 8-phosphate phosphatase (KDO 8-P phosphatase)